jgi:hypothetical protein
MKLSNTPVSWLSRKKCAGKEIPFCEQEAATCSGSYTVVIYPVNGFGPKAKPCDYLVYRNKNFFTNKFVLTARKSVFFLY